MMETRQFYERDDVQVEVVFDDCSVSPIYFGMFTPGEAFEVNIDRQDIRAVCRMLLACIRQNDVLPEVLSQAPQVGL